MIRKTILTIAAASMTMGIAACNTVEGVGEDIQSVGKAGERAID